MDIGNNAYSKNFVNPFNFVFLLISPFFKAIIKKMSYQSTYHRRLSERNERSSGFSSLLAKRRPGRSEVLSSTVITTWDI